MPGSVEMKLEMVVMPVSDVDRAKEFYMNLGWRLDADFVISDDFRLLQLTPPGSEASVLFGKGVRSAADGSAEKLLLSASGSTRGLRRTGPLPLRRCCLWCRGDDPRL